MDCSIEISISTLFKTMEKEIKRTGLGEIGSEILELLWSYHIKKKYSYKIANENPGGLEGQELLWIFQILNKDIILGLCKLDDKAKGSWSFEKVAKDLKTSPNTGARVVGFYEKIKQYRSLIKNLKDHHRNASIAHLAKKQPSIQDFQSATNLDDSINLAIKLIDQLSGGKAEFKVLDLDVREEFYAGYKPNDIDP